MQGSLPAGRLGLCREGFEPSGSLRKVSGRLTTVLLSCSPDATTPRSTSRPPLEAPLDEPGWRGIYTEYVSLSNIKCILYSKKCYRVHEIPGRFHGQAPSPGGRRDSRDRPMG